MVKKKTIFKWIILTALCAYCVFVGAWARSEAGRHVCEGIEISVEGNGKMDSVIQRGVLQHLAAYPKKIKGERLSAIDTGDIERYLARLSNFESVNCMISSGGRLKVEIVPLVPVMRVFFGNSSYYINKVGKHIESKAEFFTNVPVVTGKFTRDFRPEQILPLVRFIDNDEMMREMVGMVEARDKNNLILIPRITGHVINFGDTSRLGEKRNALKLFYNKVMPYKGWEEYDTISVKYRGQVVATRRIKPVAAPAASEVEEFDPDEVTLPDNLKKAENPENPEKAATGTQV